MIPEEQTTSKQQKKTAKKDLLKYEKPIYELKRNQEGKVESIIAKLMEKKQKPAIGIIPRSPLLDQLKQFMPVLKQSNNELLKQQIKPQQKFDAKLQEVQDSSSSSQDEDPNEMVQQSRKMQVEQQKPNPLESVDQFQFNILTYPYLNQKQEVSVETKNEETTNKSKKVVQINEEVNHLQEMQ